MKDLEHGTPEHLTEVIERAFYPVSFEKVGTVEYPHPDTLGSDKLDIKIKDGKKIDQRCVEALQARGYTITDITSFGVRVSPE